MRQFHVDKMMEFIIKVLPKLSVTFEYVVFSLLFGLLIGILVLKLKLGKNRIGRAFANGYITIMRCVPSLVMLFLVYFGLPGLLESIFHVSMQGVPVMVWVVITFSLFLGSSTAEMMRSAYQSVEKGQFEAGVTSGLTPFQTFRRIIFPQAFYSALPNLCNVVIFLFKEGALGYTVGLLDILGWGYSLSGLSGHSFALELYVGLALIYWAVTFLIERIFSVAEKQMSIEHKILKGGKKV